MMRTDLPPNEQFALIVNDPFFSATYGTMVNVKDDQCIYDNGDSNCVYDNGSQAVIKYGLDDNLINTLYKEWFKYNFVQITRVN